MLSAIRTLAAISCAFVLVLTGSSWASAGDGGVKCGSGSCTVTVTVPGSPAGPTPTSPGTGTGSGGGQAATSPSPVGSPFIPPCTYTLDTTYQPPTGADPHPTGSGAWYLKTCQLPIFSAGKSATTT